MSHIGEIISQKRQNKHMTQEEFASRLGVTPQAVSRWERGNSLPDISLIAGICKLLDVSANTLLGIENADKVVENSDRETEQEIKNNLFAEPFVIEFGSGLIPCIVAGLETDYVNQCRKMLVKETGMLLPLLRLRDSLTLKEYEVQILSYDKVLWNGNVNLPCEEAYQQLINQAVDICKEHYASILNKQLVKQLIDCVKEFYPGVADGLVPEQISYLQVERKLQEVIRDKGNIRDLIHILEEMEEAYHGNCV